MAEMAKGCDVLRRHRNPAEICGAGLRGLELESRLIFFVKVKNYRHELTILGLVSIGPTSWILPVFNTRGSDDE